MRRQCSKCGKLLPVRGTATKCPACVWKEEQNDRAAAKREKRVCVVCGKEYEILRTSKRVTCGAEKCRAQRHRDTVQARRAGTGMVTRHCVVCGTEYETSATSQRVTCGAEDCRVIRHRETSRLRVAPVSRECIVCGAPVAIGAQYLCGSEECARANRRRLERERVARRTEVRTCPICGEEYRPRRSMQKTCLAPRCVAVYSMEQNKLRKKPAKPAALYQGEYSLDHDPFNDLATMVPGLTWASPQMTPFL